MSKQTIGVGTVANDGTGDTIRAAMNKVNANFTEIYNAVGDGNTIAAAFPDFTTLTSNNLLYVNSEGTVDSLPGVTYESDGRIRLETYTTSLIPDFQVVSSNNAIVSILEYSDVPTNTAAIGLYKRRGTADSPADAQSGDVLGVVSVLGKGSATTSRLSWHVSSTTETSGTTDSHFKLTTTVNGQQVLPIQTNEDGSVRISDTYNLPQEDGVPGQLLASDGNGNLYWATYTNQLGTNLNVDIVTFNDDINANDRTYIQSKNETDFFSTMKRLVIGTENQENDTGVIISNSLRIIGDFWVDDPATGFFAYKKIHLGGPCHGSDGTINAVEPQDVIENRQYWFSSSWVDEARMKRPIIQGTPPASSSSAGIDGQIAVDNDYLYVCTFGGSDGTARWKRIALSTDTW